MLKRIKKSEKSEQTGDSAAIHNKHSGAALSFCESCNELNVKFLTELAR